MSGLNKVGKAETESSKGLALFPAQLGFEIDLYRFNAKREISSVRIVVIIEIIVHDIAGLTINFNGFLLVFCISMWVIHHQMVPDLDTSSFSSS